MNATRTRAQDGDTPLALGEAGTTPQLDGECKAAVSPWQVICCAELIHSIDFSRSKPHTADGDGRMGILMEWADDIEKTGDSLEERRMEHREPLDKPCIDAGEAARKLVDYRD